MDFSMTLLDIFHAPENTDNLGYRMVQAFCNRLQLKLRNSDSLGRL